MRLERVKRWQWIVLSLAVGFGLAQARRVDHDALPARLGEGVADPRWFEREIVRRVTLIDGSTVPAFGRLRVYPLSVVEGGRRRPVHVVAGMYLTPVDPNRPDGHGQSAPIATGRLRPYFFIAPVPYRPVADGSTHAAATVRDYLDGLSARGVAYTYAWWVDPRYATAAWVGGSFLLIGILWPTAVNLLAFGTFGVPREEKGTSLWGVKNAHSATPHRPPTASSAGPSAPSSGSLSSMHVTASAISVATPAMPDAPRAVVSPLTTVPPDTTNADAAVHHNHKEFGAKRDDFYPTELKTSPKSTA